MTPASFTPIYEGIYESSLDTEGKRPLSLFLPQAYEPRYQYPLLVMLHGRGQRESQWLNAITTISRRNYVCVALRGPERVSNFQHHGKRGFGWGSEGELDDAVEDYLTDAVDDVCSRVSINPRRIYLAGIGEGASTAYRIGLLQPFRFSRIVALNGWLPKGRVPTVFGMRRLGISKTPKVLIGHGLHNTEIPVSCAEEAHRLLYSSGWDVDFLQYQAAGEINFEMFRDIDRWLMDWTPDQ